MKIKLVIPMSALAAMGCFTLTQLKGEPKLKVFNDITAEPIATTDDAVVNLFNRSVMDRLNTKNLRRGRFSRSFITPTSYELVEVTKDQSAGVRQFEVFEILATSKKEKKVILELRYSEKEKKAEAKNGEKWVALEKHPVIMLLPILPEEAKIG